ncbi:MAG: hypothetical protein DSY66_02120 [Persephonella sp.]|nr:MAG: hypothetical protein DSY66_02120 [Persephonella sp.]
MRIYFKNLGTLSIGKVDLKPLTVFLGNCDERKFFITVLYSIFSKLEKLPERDINFIVENAVRSIWNLKNYKHIIEKLFNISDKDLKLLIKEIRRNTVNYIKGDLSNLKGTLNFQGDLKFNNFSLQDIVFSDDTEEDLALIKEKLREAIREYEKKKIALINLYSNPFNELFKYSVLRKVPKPVYIPSSRNGLVLGADYIIPNIFSKFRKVDLEFSKADIEFLEKLYLIKTAKLSGEKTFNKKIKKILDFLEERLLKGEFVEKNFVNRYKTFLFKDREDFLYPLHLIKSSILSLFPIYAILKFLNHTDNNLIIFFEEPEVHLSVDEQFELAKFLSLASNLGFAFVITTNSDYILYEFGNLLNINSMEPLIKTNYLIEKNLDMFKECVLSKENLLIYNFNCLNSSFTLEEKSIKDFIPSS